MRVLTALISPLYHPYMLGWYVCVYGGGYYTFHFSSQVFIVRAAVLESYVKDALSVHDPYLDGKNLDLKLELNAIIR